METLTKKLPGVFRILVPVLIYGLILLIWYLTSFYSYLLFHSLGEVFSIIIGCSIFILAWNSQHRLDNNYLLFLGVAYLFVSGVDLIHTLAYKGMGVFVGDTSNFATQLWIAARYMQSLSLLIAPLFLRRKLNARLLLLTYLIVTLLLVASIFAGYFPVCYVEGVGLTQFKVISEYIISLILLASIGVLLRNRAAFDGQVLRWLILSLVLTIGAELTFTQYISVYGFANLVGHLFKIIAFYFIYMAIVEMGLERPHRLLFRNLTQSESELRKAMGEVQRLAITDPLTGLYNRRHFFELGEREIQGARRYKRSLSAIMMDIDHFKLVNDTYGHRIGDQVLQEIAERCRRAVRMVDVVGRYGGEEFAIILPETDLAAACRVADRLRESISGQTIATEAGPVVVTTSLGVSTLRNGTTKLDNLLDGADQALYVAKRSGRNRVSSGEIPPSD
jgi:diguanylate cyclase (GGDEF)-like protein